MIELSLYDPGLVPNGPDGVSCFPACCQMVMRTLTGASVLSFAEVDKIIRREEGKYSAEYAMLTYLSENGFLVRFVSMFDLVRFAEQPIDYTYEYFGKEAAEDQIQNSNMQFAAEDARSMVDAVNVKVEVRVPDRSDVEGLLKDGYYLIPHINQRVLQADEGYVAHAIVVLGFNERGVIIHNPGPPATCRSEITWDLFMKAWSDAGDSSRILMAFKPQKNQ